MTETLFGGLILAAALFFIGRRLGLANFWAGVLSGLLPFLIYLVYSSRHWSGGDVLAIHFAVYLANAGVLTVFGGMQQKKQSMHWAPKAIIAFFIFLVILNAVLLSIASRGLPDRIAGFILPDKADNDAQKVHTAFPGTVPHDKNKSYQDHLAQVEQQRNLGWQVRLSGLDGLESRQGGKLTITLTDRQGQPIRAADITVGLWRMANSRDDQQLRLEEIEPGVYQAGILLPDAGRWLAKLEIRKDEFSYRQQQQFFLDN